MLHLWNNVVSFKSFFTKLFIRKKNKHFNSVCSKQDISRCNFLSRWFGRDRKPFFIDHQKTTYSLNCFYYSTNDISENKEFSRHFLLRKKCSWNWQFLIRIAFYVSLVMLKKSYHLYIYTNTLELLFCTHIFK